MIALRAQYPPPGQLVDVGGYNLHISCQGEGSPTVVMEAGLGDWSYVWTYVVPAVSSFTRVCVYDRAGWGWSDRSPQARRADVIVDEFHRLLVNGRIFPPYVLVGHSVGGPYIRLFAHKFPAEVAGMILVDSSHEEHFLRYPSAYTILDKAAIEAWFEQEKIAASGYYALYLSDFTADYANPRLPRDVDTARIALYASRPWIFGTLAEETGGLEESLAVVRNARIKLELPEAINREAMLERVRKIYTRVQREGMYLPEHVKTRLAQILKELTRTRPNLEELNPYASPILHWYFDQSGPDDPLQRTIGDLALDIVKIFDIEKILAEVQSLRVQPGHPDFLGEISDLLKSLRTAFHPDGRIDPAPYDNLARRLRQLTAPHRPFLEKNIDRAIFHI